MVGMVLIQMQDRLNTPLLNVPTKFWIGLRKTMRALLILETAFSLFIRYTCRMSEYSPTE
jgi:hypothetical protein